MVFYSGRLRSWHAAHVLRLDRIRCRVLVHLPDGLTPIASLSHPDDRLKWGIGVSMREFCGQW